MDWRLRLVSSRNGKICIEAGRTIALGLDRLIVCIIKIWKYMENALAVADGIWNSFRIWFSTIFTRSNNQNVSIWHSMRQKAFHDSKIPIQNILIKSIKFPSKMIYMFRVSFSPSLGLSRATLMFSSGTTMIYGDSIEINGPMSMSLSLFPYGFVTTSLWPGRYATEKIVLLLVLSIPCNCPIISCANMTSSVTRC